MDSDVFRDIGNYCNFRIAAYPRVANKDGHENKSRECTKVGIIAKTQLVINNL